MSNIPGVGTYAGNAAVQNWQVSVYNEAAAAEYTNKTLPEYQTKVDNWVALNTHSRELAADPSAYVPTAAPAKPQKTEWYLNPDLTLATRLVADPTIPDAVLPPFVGNQGTSIKSVAPPDPVMLALMAIHQQNTKIMAKLGVV